ncbi:hypothetical protein [Streptomyces sp. NBC_00439]|uniref:hypothetical protein n=1 Tax=Streptomyces sp. NBC_00439 TaxID=2903650 RepID=UPI0022518B95|nr:hypothetical protein [Streptomyces sp. NBC_00439]MCX5103542.1 hypothetical protein [Streptomyces sp. NBC_00439]
MPFPLSRRSHLHATQPPRYSFEPFANEVARLLGLPPALCTGKCELSSKTDHVWMLWSDVIGAVLVLNRPHRETRECLVIKVSCHHADPADVATMVRAYERRGRVHSFRSLIARVLRRS